MAGKSAPKKSVAEKAHIKPGTTSAVLNPEPGIVESLGLPKSVRFVDAADARIVCVFIRSRAELDVEMPAAVRAMQKDAAWVFFRKGSRSVFRLRLA